MAAANAVLAAAVEAVCVCPGVAYRVVVRARIGSRELCMPLMAVQCPKCGKRFRLADSHRGRQGQCAQCQHVFTLEPATAGPQEDVYRIVAEPVMADVPSAEPAAAREVARPGTPAPVASAAHAAMAGVAAEADVAAGGSVFIFLSCLPWRAQPPELGCRPRGAVAGRDHWNAPRAARALPGARPRHARRVRRPRRLEQDRPAARRAGRTFSLFR
jgi:predicted Zn finger-like uncharacterized protein